ncbi:MAG: response regulator transcription factor, partial [Bdellovibrionales bacterium]|nr:response regulator transcription factor [Bdellovibrionales bacterium]
TKPFSPSILLARLRSVLRRSERRQRTQSEIVQVDKLRIDNRRHEVVCDEDAVDLTSTEFKILNFLASHRGWVFTRDQIIDEVHGTDYPVTPRSIDVQITGLRKKLGDFGNMIETIRGVGYRFRDDQ